MGLLHKHYTQEMVAKLKLPPRGVGLLRNVDMVTGSASLPAGRRVIQPTCPCQHWNSWYLG